MRGVTAAIARRYASLGASTMILLTRLARIVRGGAVSHFVTSFIAVNMA